MSNEPIIKTLEDALELLGDDESKPFIIREIEESVGWFEMMRGRLPNKITLSKPYYELFVEVFAVHPGDTSSPPPKRTWKYWYPEIPVTADDHEDHSIEMS